MINAIGCQPQVSKKLPSQNVSFKSNWWVFAKRERNNLEIIGNEAKAEKFRGYAREGYFLGTVIGAVSSYVAHVEHDAQWLWGLAVGAGFFLWGKMYSNIAKNL